jgi:hypothetical protein
MKNLNDTLRLIEDLPGLVAFWDFQEPAGQVRRARGPHGYELQEMAGSVRRVEGGVFGPYAAELAVGQWLGISRGNCPALDIHGPDSQLSLFAWLKRRRKPHIECEAVAGMWNETRRKRQYALFLDLRIRGSADQAGGHVSGIGGPTPGHRYCMDAAIGRTGVEYTEAWEFVGFTYDSMVARLYRNGCFDPRPTHNPYPYPGGLFDGGSDGADFTVGAVHRGGEMGNWFTGFLGGLIVCSSVLPPETIRSLADSTIPGCSEKMLHTIRDCERNLDYTTP